MFRSWRFGRLFDIDLYLHGTLLLFLPLIMYSSRNADNSAGFVLATTLAVYGCILLHEFGHALAAQLFGIGTRSITLYPIGGVAMLRRVPERPLEELVITIAGPLVNVIIAAGLYFGLLLGGQLFAVRSLDSGSIGVRFLSHVFWANVILFAFNMLPAFPMDGGRLLRAFLSLFIPRVRATSIAALLGILVAGGFVVLGVIGGNLVLAAVGVFVIIAGRQELAMVRLVEAERLRREQAGPVVDVVPLSATAAGTTGFVWDPERKVWLVWPAGAVPAAESAPMQTGRPG